MNYTQKILLVPSLIWFSGSLLSKLPVCEGFADKGPIFNMNMKTISLNHLFYASSVSMSNSRNSSLPVWSHHLQLLPRLGWAACTCCQNVWQTRKYSLLWKIFSLSAQQRRRRRSAEIWNCFPTPWEYNQNLMDNMDNVKTLVITKGEVDNWIVLQ